MCCLFMLMARLRFIRTERIPDGKIRRGHMGEIREAFNGLNVIDIK